MEKLRKTVSRIGTDIRQYYWAGIGFLVCLAGAQLLFGAFCPQLVITGIPCAGCGLTRAALRLMRGQLRQAAQINPSIFPVIAFLIYCGYFRYVKGKKIRKPGLVLALLVACMLVVYAYGMYRYFPERAPYVYYQNNVLARRVPGYEGWIRSIAD